MQQPNAIPSNTPATVSFAALAYALGILRVTPQRPDESFPAIAELERGYTAAIQSVANPPPPPVNFEERALEEQAAKMILVAVVKAGILSLPGVEGQITNLNVRGFVDELGVTAGVEPAVKARYDKVIDKLQALLDEPAATASSGEPAGS